MKNFLLLILITFYISSCRCSIDYKINPATSFKEKIIDVNANEWEGDFQYLRIEIKINRDDSLYVKNISITPILESGKTFPNFADFSMYSFYFKGDNNKKEKVYWKKFRANKFEYLPEENRLTNKGNSYIYYTANYKSLKTLELEKFSANIIVLLKDKFDQIYTYKRKVVFEGERKCYFSVH